MLGEIISAVGDIAGGLMNRGSHQSSGEDLKSRVEMARKLGLSPLAVLGSPLTSGYGPINAMGDGVANAAHSIGRALTKDPNDDLNRRLLEAQINNQNAQAADAMSSARSRTLLSQVRSAATSGPTPVLKDYAGHVLKQGPGSDYGDLAKRYGMTFAELMGIMNAVKSYSYELPGPPNVDWGDWWRRSALGHVLRGEFSGNP